MKYLFGNGPTTPCPRKENHFMYQMPFIFEQNIFTGVDGSVWLTLAPFSVFASSVTSNPK